MRSVSTILFLAPCYIALCILLCSEPKWSHAQQEAPSPSHFQASLVEIDQLISENQFAQAAERMRLAEDTADQAIRLVQIARGLQQSGDLEAAVQFFLRAVSASALTRTTSPESDDSASDRPPAIDANSFGFIHLGAASALIQAGKAAEAIDCLLPILTGDRSSQDRPQATDDHQQMAIRLCLHVGADSLRQGKLSLAERAYRIAVDKATEPQREPARLGAAWTKATAGDQGETAGNLLRQFVDDYPENPDVPRALRLAAASYRQAGLSEESTAMLTRLLEHWPESSSAEEVVRSHTSLPISEVSDAVQDWLLRRAEAAPTLALDSSSLDSAICTLGVRVAVQASRPDAIDAYSQRLARIDQTGQATSDLLQHLIHANRLADAERMVTMWLASEGSDRATTATREAACRWAGRQELWSLLAMAAESTSPDAPDETRTATMERLFAEALMQLGRSSDAYPWWQSLVDSRGADDFATLVRCAETATSHGSLQEAESRIQAARPAAEQDIARQSLLDMLSAELSIRKLDFDAGRNLLESIIREPESIDQLRGRAQWLIGETYFLQQRYADAIDAYRRVEGIAPDGPWVAAALLQAGKSFEQLGRTREASVCYSTLISRFADSHYCQTARTRMAAIDPRLRPESPSDNPSPSSDKLRR